VNTLKVNNNVRIRNVIKKVIKNYIGLSFHLPFCVSESNEKKLRLTLAFNSSETAKEHVFTKQKPDLMVKRQLFLIFPVKSFMLNAGKIHGYNEIGNISNNPQPHKS
jgi:hypothetical protein